MLKFLFFSISMLAFRLITTAQATDYKVIFDLTSNDPVAQQQVIRDAGLIKAAHPDAQLEVVVYGQGLDLVRKDKSSEADAVAKLSRQGVVFKACHVAMDRQHVTESQLIPGVQTVPDGIYEIISKQHQGFGYIKIAH